MAALSTLLLGGSLAQQLAPAAAQTPPGQTTAGFAAPGQTSATTSQTSLSAAADATFAVQFPSIQRYYRQHGGARTLGQPLSHDFQLLGHRVQIFDNQVIEQRKDGTVGVLDLLGDALPLAHADGLTFPLADPDMTAANPSLDTPGYQALALAAIDGGLLDSAAPDTWYDIPVNFGTTFRSTVSCADLGSASCDDRTLLSAAVDVWGLPTSQPTQDPNNADLIYLRFQRGIMQYSQSTGVTQVVPLGSYFKRVLIGTDVPDDLAVDMAGSQYLAQYAPNLPLGVARPADLPATSLAAAFSAASSLQTAGFGDAVTPSATPVFASALPSFDTSSTPVATFATPAPATTLGDTSGTTSTGTLSGTPGALAQTPTALTPSGTQTPSALASTVSTPTTPQGPDPCAGDEQLMFAPLKPYAGTDVLIAATSARHHDVRSVRLTGPIKTGAVNERQGLNGWVWEWTVSPATEGWYEFTFFVDGTRACATSGFNVLPAFGATATPTATSTTAFATSTPIPTATVTPTATSVPAPSLAATGAANPASGACGNHLLQLSGNNFGSSQSALNGNVLFAGANGSSVATIYSWTNNSILLSVPAGSPKGTYQIVVTTSAGATSPLTYDVGTC